MSNTAYTILAPADATIADVSRLAVETYFNEESPPDHIKVEPIGVDPSGNSVWGVEVSDGPASAQEAHTEPDSGSPGDSITPSTETDPSP